MRPTTEETLRQLRVAEERSVDCRGRPEPAVSQHPRGEISALS